MYSETLGKLHFWWMFVLYHVTFLPMFWVGLQGMNRRVANYPAELANLNVFISVASFLLAASFVVLVVNLVRAWIRGPTAAANPWRARTLEWQTPSPPPEENFKHAGGGGIALRLRRARCRALDRGADRGFRPGRENVRSPVAPRAKEAV